MAQGFRHGRALVTAQWRRLTASRDPATGIGSRLIAGPRRCRPSQLHRMHQLVRNHGMSMFHPLDSTRNVTSSQMGHRSPSGRMKRNTIVATTIRNTKKATRTTAKTTGPHPESGSVTIARESGISENHTAYGSSSWRSIVLHRSTQATPSSMRSMAISVPASIAVPSRLRARARCHCPSN